MSKVSKKRNFTLIELLVKRSHLCCDRVYGKEEGFSPAHGQVKLYSFTLIELLVVIAIIAITTSSSIRVKFLFFIFQNSFCQKVQ